MAAPELVVRVAANLDTLRSNLAEGINQIETTSGALARMSSAYDGAKVVSQAGATVAAIQNIGGVTKLTTDEQARALPILDQAIAKYAVLGKDAPKSMTDLAASLREAQSGAQGATGWFQALGESWAAHIAEGILVRDVIREVISFAKEAVTETARIEDLARATGMSAEEVQKFTYVGKEFGVTGEEMARGVEQLSAKLANGDKNAVSAVQMLGLNVKALLAQGPAAAFLDVADATGRVEDPMTRGGLAAQEFGGKLAKILLPALGELRTKLKEVPQDAIISDENVKKAHDFDVGLAHLETQLKATTVAFIGWIAASGSKGGLTPGDLHNILDSAHGVSHGDDVAIPSAESTSASLTNAQLIQNALTALRTAALEPLTLAQQANIDALKKWGASADEIAKLVTNGNVTAVERYLNAERELGKQIAESDAILMASFEKRTAGLKAVTEANLHAYDFGGQIASLTQLMASEEALARSVYDQLSSEKDRAKVIEELALRRTEIQNQINALEQRHAGLVNAQIIAELDARRQLEAAVGRNVDGTFGELNAYDKMMVALDRLHDKKQEGISQYNQENLIIEQYTDSEYAAAIAVDAEIQALAKKKAALDAVAQSMITITTLSLPQKAGTAQEQTDLKTVTDRVNARGMPLFTIEQQNAYESAIEAGMAALGYGAPTLAGIKLPGRALGGDVMPRQAYTVGERGPETLVMGSAGGTVLPNGAGGVTIMPGAIVFNNAILNDPAGKRALLALMNEVMTGRLTGTGTKMPTGT